MMRPSIALFTAVLTLHAVAACPAIAAFHLWHVKEVFSNADGSVQFIELFDSFSNEQFVANHTVRANSDGVIKNFVIPGNLPNNPSTANGHMLIATPGFGSLPGAVTPNFTLPDPGVSGPFFNPNANSITISFLGSSDAFTFSGSLLPKDGFNSLTDMNASGLPPGASNIQVTANTPTRFANVAGQIDLRTPAPGPTGDYNGNGTVDAADFVVWRNTLSQTVSAGTGADGSGNGTVDNADYTFWRARFGSSVPATGSTTAVPEPTAATLTFLALGLLGFPPRKPRIARSDEC